MALVRVIFRRGGGPLFLLLRERAWLAGGRPVRRSRARWQGPGLGQGAAWPDASARDGARPLARRRHAVSAPLERRRGRPHPPPDLDRPHEEPTLGPGSPRRRWPRAPRPTLAGCDRARDRPSAVGAPSRRAGAGRRGRRGRRCRGSPSLMSAPELPSRSSSPNIDPNARRPVALALRSALTGWSCVSVGRRRPLCHGWPRRRPLPPLACLLSGSPTDIPRDGPSSGAERMACGTNDHAPPTLPRTAR